MVHQIEKIFAPHNVSGPIQITLLGTGTSQGIPVIGCPCRVCTSPDPKDKRLRTSAYVKVADMGLLIDIGPDFRAQMLANHLDDIHAILITHEHNDHVSGLDDIRPVNFMHHRDMPIYGSLRTLEELERRFYYAFDAAYLYPGKPRVTGIPIDGTNQFSVGDVSVSPVLVDHGGLDVFGFRIGRFAYITDAKTIPDKSLEKLMELDVLVLNALRFETHDTHLNIAEAVDICKKVNPKQCYLTHISHDMGCHAEVNALLPPNIRLGYDGLTVNST